MLKLFSMKGRINRKSFLTIYILALVFSIVIIHILSFLLLGIKTVIIEGKIVTPPNTLLEYLEVSLIIIVVDFFMAVIMAFQIVKRLHDIYKPSTNFWLLLIPIYNLYLIVVLFFKKGDDGPTGYGPDPIGKYNLPIDNGYLSLFNNKKFSINSYIGLFMFLTIFYTYFSETILYAILGIEIINAVKPVEIYLLGFVYCSVLTLCIIFISNIMKKEWMLPFIMGIISACKKTSK